jgi:hypothetical protein
VTNSIHGPVNCIVSTAACLRFFIGFVTVVVGDDFAKVIKVVIAVLLVLMLQMPLIQLLLLLLIKSIHITIVMFVLLLQVSSARSLFLCYFAVENVIDTTLRPI